ncbi:hypothetical protein [Pseudomonas lundensis]|uniref:hypothetical protein n=1 Tax=Pseudomonas lundensis TaxID=86185 RepID=UPI000A9DD2BB|nr:hypothetical protein [Pseudomonas lundensis]
MEFRHLGNGQTFPPVAPNGRGYAIPVTQENHVEIFCLTPEGIVGSSVAANWAEITGFYYDDKSWEIILRNYTGRGMRFRRGHPCFMRRKHTDEHSGVLNPALHDEPHIF